MLDFFSCKKIAKLISASQDQTLPWQSRLVMKLHIFVCKYCKRFEKQIHHIDAMIQKAGKDGLPSHQHLSQEAKRRINDSISKTMQK